MADSTISQLNEVTSPLTTDILPIVNSGETKKISLSSINNNLPITSFVQSNSSSWNNQGLASVNYVNTNFFPLSGGTISGPVRIDNNLTVNGEISATSHITTSGKIYIQNDGNSDQWNTAYNVATAYQSASSDYVLQGGNSTTVALSVGTNTTQPLILETNNLNRVTILSSGNVGIGNINPNNTLTVAGSISSTSIVYASGGNSNQWNAAANLLTTVPITTSFYVPGYNLIQATGTPSNLRVFTVPAGRRFIAKMLLGATATATLTGVATAPTLRLVNVTQGNTGMVGSWAPATTTLVTSPVPGAHTTTNANSIIAQAGEDVALRLITAATGFSVLTVDVVVDGFLI